MSRKITRRAILTGLGTSLALPYLPSWRGDSGNGVITKVRAADECNPRVVFWYAPWGSVPPYWDPIQNSTTDRRDWTASEILAPIGEFKDRTNVISGMNLTSVPHSRGGAGGVGHEMAASHVLSASFEDSPGWWGDAIGHAPGGPSIEHVLGARLPEKRFRTLIMGDTTEHLDEFQRDEDGNRGANHAWPHQVWDAAFQSQAGTEAERDLRRQGRVSVLNNVHASFQHLRARVSPADQRVLDRHLDGLNDVERRLLDVSSCSAPERGHEAQWTETGGWSWPTPEGPYESMFDMAAAALACDMTSAMTIRFSANFVNFAEMLPASIWDQVADAGKRAELQGLNSHGHCHAHFSDTDALFIAKEVEKYKMGVFNGFLRRLDGVTEENGHSMLDNTIVVYVSDMMTGLHGINPGVEWGYWSPDAPHRNDESRKPKGVPCMTVGGGQAGLSVGNHHDFTQTHTYYDRQGKYSNCELYLTIARALGVTEAQLPSFGHADLCNNLMTEILAG